MEAKGKEYFKRVVKHAAKRPSRLRACYLKMPIRFRDKEVFGDFSES